VRGPRLRHLAALAFALASAALGSARVAAQEAGPRVLRGRVITPIDSGEPRPMPGVWVTLHRIGHDRAGPVDSVRTAQDGGYAFRVRIADDDSASWIASALHAGIAHFSDELSASGGESGAGEIVVFDTTGAPLAMHVEGRHLVLFGGRAGAPREVLEVYEIANEGTRTAVSRDDAHPVWSAPLPSRATDVRLEPGDLAPEAARLDGGRVRVYAPITPGLRRIAFRYRLPASAFPFEVVLREDAQALEVLVEDPLARVDARGLVEQDRSTFDGRPFRRFLARHASRGTVLRVELPGAAVRRRVSAVAIVAGIAAVAMCAALFVGLRRPADAELARAIA
jgi:hypothetical protein